LLRGLCMARGRHTTIMIRLTTKERQTLLAWQRSTSIPAGRARRGRVILLMADRVPISHIADTVGISRRFVYKWVQRFLQEGVAGLVDKPGRGRRAEPGVVHVTANGSSASDV
jgi:biotin operon repressor